MNFERDGPSANDETRRAIRGGAAAFGREVMLPDRTPQRTAPPRKHNIAQIFTLGQQRIRCVVIGDQALDSKLLSVGNRSAPAADCHIFGTACDKRT